MAAPAAVSHTGSTTSPEYIAFQANYEVLIKTVGAEPGNICDALFAKGYISPGVRDYVRAVGIMNIDKARRLVDAVIAQIRHNPDVFHGFINMPINQTDFISSAIQKMKESFETELKKQKDSLSSQEDMKILNELSSHLRSYRLDDCDYWVPQLKALGVQSKTSLRHIEGKLENFSKLEVKVRNHVEKIALKKLLKMDELIRKRRKKVESDKLREQAERHCMRLGESRQAISQFEQNRKSFTTKITRQVPRYVASIKRKEQEEFHELVYTKRELNEDQFQRIIKRETFTSGMLKSYEKQSLISEDQVKLIQTVIENCNGQLTAAALTDIMFGEILRLEQVEQILLKGRQTVEELEVEFNRIWTKCIKEFEFWVPIIAVDVESEVESAMNYFVRTKGYEVKLIEKREKDNKSIRAWGVDLEFQPKEKVHFNKVKAYSWSTRFPGPIKKLMYYFQDGTLKAEEALDHYQAEVMIIRETAVRKALDYLNHITKQRTGFKTEFTQDLLEKVDSSITEEAEQFKDRLTITPEFRLTVFLKVCGYALPYFEEMARTFVEETDPRQYLEKHVRKPLFIAFKKEYYQIKAEEAIVSTLCTRLEVAIRDQIKNTIGAVMVGQMKDSDHHFSSKMAFKVKILTDLYKEDNFEGYLAYLIDVKACLQERIKRYTVQYCDQRLSGGTRLQIAAKAEVNRLIQVVKSIVTKITKTNSQEWLVSFSADPSLSSNNLGFISIDNFLPGFDFPNELSDNFRSQIQNGLEILKKTLHATYGNVQCKEDITQWKDEPHELLSNLIGCTKQCPLCGEQCDSRDPDHCMHGEHKHYTQVHRPSCLAGLKEKYTQVMTLDCCTSLVKSRREFLDVKSGLYYPYRQYGIIYPEWFIPCDPTAENSLYWKWFVGRYAKELAETYGGSPADIPIGWLDIQWPDVARSLEEEAYRVLVPR